MGLKGAGLFIVFSRTIVEGNETFAFKLGDVTDTTAVQDAAITTEAQATAMPVFHQLILICARMEER